MINVSKFVAAILLAFHKGIEEVEKIKAEHPDLVGFIDSVIAKAVAGLDDAAIISFFSDAAAQLVAFVELRHGPVTPDHTDFA